MKAIYIPTGHSVEILNTQTVNGFVWYQIKGGLWSWLREEDWIPATRFRLV